MLVHMAAKAFSSQRNSPVPSPTPPGPEAGIIGNHNNNRSNNNRANNIIHNNALQELSSQTLNEALGLARF